MLVVRDIWKGFDTKQVLQGINFQLKSSSIAGLIGPSGCGKSLLLKIIGGVREPQRGTVTFRAHRDADLANQPLAAGSDALLSAAQISLMFQEGALFDSLSVLDNVAFPLVNGRVPIAALPHAQRDLVVSKVEVILARLGLSRAAYKMPAQLSGGMRRRVSLARALVARPELVLLDDPTSGLDPVASSVIMDLISELHREYLPTMILASHDLRRLLPVVDVVIALFGGLVLFQGTPEDLADADLPDVKHFIGCRYNLAELKRSTEKFKEGQLPAG